MPESLRDENGAEVNGRKGVASIHRRLGDGSFSANLSECWHDVYSAGRGEYYLCREYLSLGHIRGPGARVLSPRRNPLGANSKKTEPPRLGDDSVGGGGPVAANPWLEIRSDTSVQTGYCALPVR